MEPYIFIKKYKILTLFLLLSILTITVVNYALADIPQCWKYGYVTGQIFTNLAIGYIVSLLFFFLVVYLKEKKDQDNISPRISKSIIRILATGDRLEIMLFKGQKNSSRDPKKIQEICDTTTMYDINYSSNIRKLHWVDFMTNIAEDCKYYMDKIFKLNEVDTELIRILTELDDSFMLARSQLVVGHSDNDKRPITPLYNQIIQFFNIVSDLEKYWKSNFSHYTEHEKLRRKGN